MQILITGVSSFLGKNVAKYLLSEGHKVIGVVRPTSRNLDVLSEEGLEDLEIVRFNFDELPEYSEERYRDAFRDFDKESSHIDVWIHFSWDGVGSRGRQDSSIQSRNYENARKAYLMARLLGCEKFIFAGSQAEYGRGTHEEPIPVSEYGKAKLRFSKWAFEHIDMMKFIHLRIYSIYGYGDHPSSLIDSLVKACLSGTELTLGPCTQNWNYLEISDFARLFKILCDTSIDSGIYDIAGYETKPLREYVLEGSEAMMNYLIDTGVPQNTGLSLNFGIRKDNAEGNHGMNPDISKIVSLGFKQDVSFRDGIVRILERYMDHR